MLDRINDINFQTILYNHLLNNPAYYYVCCTMYLYKTVMNNIRIIDYKEVYNIKLKIN